MQTTEAIDPIVQIMSPKPVDIPVPPASEFHSPVLVHHKDGSTSYTPVQLQALYECVRELVKKTGRASCYEWVKELEIPYAVACVLMDHMESRKLVKPLKDGESGARKV